MVQVHKFIMKKAGTEDGSVEERIIQMQVCSDRAHLYRSRLVSLGAPVPIYTYIHTSVRNTPPAGP